MKIVTVSDLHGHLPKLPECDLVLIGGDICPVHNHKIDFQIQWLNNEFREWLLGIKAEKIVAVAGNHDLVFERNPKKIPDLPWEYLLDSSIIFRDMKIWGSPWQLNFGIGWAFNAAETSLKKKWSKIPTDTDILLLHSPPYGYGDLVIRRNGEENVGSPSLLKRINKIKPKLVVSGHIHSGFGRYEIGEKTIFINASLVDEYYSPVNEPFLLDLVHGTN